MQIIPPTFFAEPIDIIWAQVQARTQVACHAWWQNKSTHPIQVHAVLGNSQSYIRQHQAHLAAMIAQII